LLLKIVRDIDFTSIADAAASEIQGHRAQPAWILAPQLGRRLASPRSMRSFQRILIVVTAGCSTVQGTHSSPADAPTGTIELACQSHGTTFPVLDKACAVASDCFIADHVVSCCGTQIAIGLNVSTMTAFVAAEQACQAAYPSCDCDVTPTMAEDGRSSVDGAITVQCDQGLCRTSVP
jgi:hypothetical protein